MLNDLYKDKTRYRSIQNSRIQIIQPLTLLT